MGTGSPREARLIQTYQSGVLTQIKDCSGILLSENALKTPELIYGDVERTRSLSAMLVVSAANGNRLKMSIRSMVVRRTYKFRLYHNDKRDAKLQQQINIAGLVWNHALALQRRYYRLTGKYIGLGRLKKHIAKLRMKTQRFAFWKDLGSQAVQDVLGFETLNIDGMKRLWGRKVSDLGFAQFVQIMQWVASKRGKRVVFVDQWSPTSQTCSGCGARQQLELSQRLFVCGHCGLMLDRDHNAAINIRAGASAHTAKGEVRLSSDSIAVDGRTPRHL